MQDRRDHRRRLILLRNTFSNLGDVAMMEAEIHALSQCIPEAHLTVLSDDHRLASQFPSVQWGEGDLVLSGPAPARMRAAVRGALASSPRWIGKVADRVLSRTAATYRTHSVARFLEAGRRLARGESPPSLPPAERRLLDALMQADLVIGGGGLIGRIPAIADPRRALYQALREMQVPYVLHGLSLTDDWEDGTYSGASLVVVRDRRASLKRALECGVPETRLLSFIDPAFMTKPPDVAVALRSSGLSPGRYIAVNVREFETPLAQAGALLDQFAAGVIQLVRRSNIDHLLLFGMQRYRANDDGFWLAALQKRLKRFVNSARWPAAAEHSEVRGIVAQARAVISCRYHGALFALAAGIPAVGMIPRSEYDVKMKGLFAWYDLERFCASVDDGIPEGAIAGLAEHNTELRAHIVRRNRDLAAECKRPYERIRELLGLTS